MNSALFVSAIFLIAVLGCVLWGRRQRRLFNERYPAISDAKFMALCSPEVSPFVALRVRRALSEALNIDYERIYPSSRPMGDLGAE